MTTRHAQINTILKLSHKLNLLFECFLLSRFIITCSMFHSFSFQTFVYLNFIEYSFEFLLSVMFRFKSVKIPPAIKILSFLK